MQHRQTPSTVNSAPSSVRGTAILPLLIAFCLLVAVWQFFTPAHAQVGLDRAQIPAQKDESNEEETKEWPVLNPFGLDPIASWSVGELTRTTSVVWGDIDLDGDLDIVLGTDGAGTKIFRNDGVDQQNKLKLLEIWSDHRKDPTRSIALGDLDNDGDLDLVIGNGIGAHNRIYRNDQTYVTDHATWQMAEMAQFGGPDLDTTSVALGDANDDGRLDLAVGNNNNFSQVLLNLGGGTLNLNAIQVGTENAGTQSVAWGHLNFGDETQGGRDQRLDLAVGNYGSPSKVYLNTLGDDGRLVFEQSISLDHSSYAHRIAWTDFNLDGNADLIVGSGIKCLSSDTVCNTTEASKIYRNVGDHLDPTPAWRNKPDDEPPPPISLDCPPGLGCIFLPTVAGGGGAVQAASQNNEPPGKREYADCSQANAAQTCSIALGDINRDGMPDIILGNRDEANQLFLNITDKGTQTITFTLTAWRPNDTFDTLSAALGDADGDGDLDLLTGKDVDLKGDQVSGKAYIYQNEAEALDIQHPVPISGQGPITTTLDLAWGDVFTGDDHLEVLAVNPFGTSAIFCHGLISQDSDHGYSPCPASPPGVLPSALSGAWADIDGDGNLDLVLGKSRESNRVYINSTGGFTLLPIFPQSIEASIDTAIADFDGQGPLDVMFANTSYFDDSNSLQFVPSRVYPNVGGILQGPPLYEFGNDVAALSAAWGDIDNDGDLDLALGTSGQNRIYYNIGGFLQTDPSQVWLSDDSDYTNSVAWGDMDGNGTLDLAVGNGGIQYGQRNKIYLNVNGVLTTTNGWASDYADRTSQVAWGDVDSDGDLDLAVTNVCNASGTVSCDPNLIYLNVGGRLQTSPTWVFAQNNPSLSLAWGDANSDGLLDLAVGNQCFSSTSCSPIDVLLNRRPLGLPSLAISLYSDAITTFRGGESTALAPANFYSVPGIRSGMIPINYSLHLSGLYGVRELQGYYSLNGGGKWEEAKTSVEQLPLSGTYNWDVNRSGLFGQSDNVVFRLVAYPDLEPVNNGVAGPYQYGAFATQTFPFRVRGNQVRVLRSDPTTGTISPVQDRKAVVYRLADEQIRNGAAFVDEARQPYHSDSQGYLQGRGVITSTDRLIALYPERETLTYTLYSTNLPIQPDQSPNFTSAGVELGGVIPLTVTSMNPLIVFPLTVSLEWDASNDGVYMQQLKNDFQRASELLYDWTNGQVALGDVTLYFEREHWDQANVRIFASNRLRPNAAQGGVVLTELVDNVTFPDNETRVITYTRGYVNIGATWNRYGNLSGNLGDDWPRALAHELSHYLLFLQDNYLGFDASGNFVVTYDNPEPGSHCRGAMADPYRDSESEFYPKNPAWNAECANTFSNYETGRSDWETIKHFYPDLHQATVPFVNGGPDAVPIAILKIITESLSIPFNRNVLSGVPAFKLVNANGATSATSGTARAFLFWKALDQNSGNEFDRIVDLGAPSSEQVLARGVHSRDKLCVFDLAGTPSQYGCLDNIAAVSQTVVLNQVVDWNPDLIITPRDAYTLQLVVRDVPARLDTLQATVYPIDNEPPPLKVTTPQGAGGVYTFTFAFTKTVSNGFVHLVASDSVYSQNSSYEVVVDFSLGDSPGPSQSRVNRSAPVISADGQVLVYGLDPLASQEDFYTIQTATSLSGTLIPSWVTPVGQAYQLLASDQRTDLENGTIIINYFESDVPPGEEQWLRTYYSDDSGQWHLIEQSQVITQQNYVAAPLQPGAKLYTLMSSVPTPLDGPGWNIFAYLGSNTTPASAPVNALRSINGWFNLVWGYNGAKPDDPWLSFDTSVDPSSPWFPYVNDLTSMSFGRGYWIHVTASHPITLYVKGGFSGQVVSAADQSTLPPALFYGPVLNTSDFTPTVDLPVTAWIEGKLCGEATTKMIGGTLGYVIHVKAGAGGDNAECGVTGHPIQFKVGDRIMNAQAVWNNTEAVYTPLVTHYDYHTFLPLITHE